MGRKGKKWARKQRDLRNGVVWAKETYVLRDERLAGMGYGSYAEYLASALWSKIRERVFRERGVCCCICGLLGSEVHHQDYSRKCLEGEDVEQLHVLCNKCHHCVEFTVRGTKRTFRAARRRFHAMQRYTSQGMSPYTQE